jgi:hypothetical protein
VKENKVVEEPSVIKINERNKITKKVKDISDISMSSVIFSEEDQTQHDPIDSLLHNSKLLFLYLE